MTVRRCERSRCDTCTALRQRATELAGWTDPDHTEPYTSATVTSMVNGVTHVGAAGPPA